ncbi:MAG: hypothetical protein HKN23_14600 [Verrucomicrobiales bacterium]|nr:hypothetical protein [Verrucomicrobiales bacterium]
MTPAFLAFPIFALTWPPALPDGKSIVTGTDPNLLVPTETLRENVKIAKTGPTVDFLYYDCQTYEAEGGVWSHWGDGLVVGDIFYSAVGDHMSPGGNAFVYGYDSKTKKLTQLTDLRSILKQPDGHYTPGKIHSQIGLGKDGWLYFSTHRGSTRIAFHPTANFKGDWIVRYHPETKKSEVVAFAPLEMQCLPTGQLDPERLIFYAGTADGLKEKEPQFLAYDLRNRKVLAQRDRGPARAMIQSKSNGCVYFHAEKSGAHQLLKFDPEKPGEFTPIDAEVGLRAATQESSKGKVYTIEKNSLWEFDVKTETAKLLGETAAASRDYITSVDLCPATERYFYYVPGSHGGAQNDGSPLIQYDLQTGERKVICFLADFCEKRAGFIPMGSYCSAVSEDGGTVFITWMGNVGGPEKGRNGRPGKLKFNTNALTVVHIPESERQP